MSIVQSEFTIEEGQASGVREMLNQLFITLEGGEGVGKSTLLRRLVEKLSSRGYDVITTREPGGTPIAEQIRTVLLDPDNTMMDARTEALLYAAARRQHVVETLLPALAAGKFVISDRYVDSSLVYQGYTRGLGMQDVWAINQYAMDGLMPSLTLYLDMDTEDALHRIHVAAEREVNRLDLEAMDFHEQVRLGYLQLQQQAGGRIVVVNAAQAPDTVFAEAWSVLEQHLQQHR
jgi:dTMP kinase